jgi:dephospho-CoA kinase
VNVAVTGGLGSGKSTVSKILAVTLNTELLDADQLCRRQMLPGAEGFEKFRRSFGERCIKKDGTLDRTLLRQAVFNDKELRDKLERILHPIVRSEIAVRSRACSDRGKVLIVEVPLLYEVGWQDEFDACVVVYVPEGICVQRVIERDGMLVEDIKQILNAQIPIKKKLDYTHFIVDNSGTFVSTVHQIVWLSRKLNME